MLPKKQTRSFRYRLGKIAGIALVIEAVGFVFAYGVYRRTNSDRDFRQYLSQKYPFILDYYYKVGETLGNYNTRQTDAAIWLKELSKRD